MGNPIREHSLPVSSDLGDGPNCLATLVRRNGKTLSQLLTRLDYAIGPALTEDIFTDEING